MSAANRLYAIDLLNRAGVQLAPREIAILAAVIPLIERDVVDTVAAPVDGVFFTAQAIIRARIVEGRHRPSHSITPGLLDPTQPGDPAAAPKASTGGAAALSELIQQERA